MTASAGEAVEFIGAHTRPDAVDEVARAHLAEWGDLYPAATPSTVAAELLTDVDGPASPSFRRTWFATIDGVVVGSVSLRGGGEVDAADESKFPGPWLANLWVDPAHRGRGIASTLLDHAMSNALALGIGRLRLVTTDAVALYTRRRWSIEADITVGGRPATVMVTTVAP